MERWDKHSSVVAEASGMVSVQAACTIDDAFELIEARADMYPSETIESIAAAVVERRIRFDLAP